MKTFEEIISLLNPDEKYNPVLRQCQQLWDSFSSEKQDYVYRVLKEKKERKDFVDYNPLFAIKRTYRAPQPVFLRGDEPNEDIVQVRYNGAYKLCSRDTMRLFNLEFVRDW